MNVWATHVHVAILGHRRRLEASRSAPGATLKVLLLAESEASKNRDKVASTYDATTCDAIVVCFSIL